MDSDVDCGDSISNFSENSMDYEETEEYIVERILDRRRYMGQIQYLVKWLDYSDEDNTWESAADLDCHSLINSFESQISLKRGQELNNQYESKAKRLKIDPFLVVDSPFNHGFTAQEILKGSKNNGEISFLIRFCHLDQPQVVPSGIAYVEIPQMVLKFYENHCDFHDLNNRNNYIS
ncbi:heterochromatin protein 1 [Drosophila sechellia]|uniref:GM23793 n=1 Tax=Drosophila sechellia TaxID=7238 RepID=B4HKF9_DROSE|nr:heterochromatin protein 1 [Drosophila sechellia]EDW42909.1 GM23793 [Drosophila sechellia]